MTARGWVGFVSLAIAVGGATVMIVQSRQRATTGDEPADVVAPSEGAGLAPRPRRVTVPDLVGLHRGEAWRRVGDALLFPQAEYVEAGPEKADVILSQEPPAGQQEAIGSIVVVRLGRRASVPVPQALPDVRGKPQADAARELISAGFSPSVEFVTGGAAQAGTVVSQLPEPGPSTTGTRVVLRVAKPAASTDATK